MPGWAKLACALVAVCAAALLAAWALAPNSGGRLQDQDHQSLMGRLGLILSVDDVAASCPGPTEGNATFTGLCTLTLTPPRHPRPSRETFVDSILRLLGSHVPYRQLELAAVGTIQLTYEAPVRDGRNEDPLLRARSITLPTPDGRTMVRLVVAREGGAVQLRCVTPVCTLRWGIPR